MRMWRIVPAVLCSLAVAACSFPSSPETHYYVLTSPADAALPAGQSKVSGPRVAVGPVTIPGYLDHNRLFLRKENSPQVRLTEYHHWSEPLAEGVSRLLCDTISNCLGSRHGLAFPLRAGLSPDWRVNVDIARFDGSPGGTVMLDAGWMIATPHGDSVLQGRFVDRLSAGDTVAEVVRAQAQLLDRLGKVLAKAVIALEDGLKTGRAD